MSDMIRKQIYLERRQVKAVRNKAKVLGMNESELIRQAIDRDLYGSGSTSNRPDPEAWDEIEAFLMSQKDKPLAGDPYKFIREEIYQERLSRFNATDSH